MLNGRSAPPCAELFVHDHPDRVDINISWREFWEALVLNMRTETISYSVYKRRQMKGEETQLMQKIQDMENTEHNLLTNHDHNELATWKEKLEHIGSIKIEGIITRSRVRWYEQGEKHSGYFLNLEKRNYTSRQIRCLTH